MGRKVALIIGALALLAVLACVVIGVGGVVWYIFSGSLDIPYPDGPPPTPSVLP